MKYLDALLKAGIIVMLYLILVALVQLRAVEADRYADIHLIRHDLGKIANRLDAGIIRFEVKGNGG